MDGGGGLVHVPEDLLHCYSVLHLPGVCNNPQKIGGGGGGGEVEGQGGKMRKVNREIRNLGMKDGGWGGRGEGRIHLIKFILYPSSDSAGSSNHPSGNR